MASRRAQELVKENNRLVLIAHLVKVHQVSPLAAPASPEQRHQLLHDFDPDITHAREDISRD